MNNRERSMSSMSTFEKGRHRSLTKNDKNPSNQDTLFGNTSDRYSGVAETISDTMDTSPGLHHSSTKKNQHRKSVSRPHSPNQKKESKSNFPRLDILTITNKPPKPLKYRRWALPKQLLNNFCGFKLPLISKSHMPNTFKVDEYSKTKESTGFSQIAYGDKIMKVVNNDCKLRNFLPYVKKLAGIGDGKLLFVSKEGETVRIFENSLETRATSILRHRETYIPVILHQDEYGFFQGLEPLLLNGIEHFPLAVSELERQSVLGFRKKISDTRVMSIYVKYWKKITIMAALKRLSHEEKEKKKELAAHRQSIYKVSSPNIKSETPSKTTIKKDVSKNKKDVQKRGK